MNSTVPLRVVFLTQGEAPPQGVVQMLQHPQVEVEGHELDAFFAALDGGMDAPDLLVGVGGESLVGALRRHALTACLPLFRWGSTTTVPPGWDGSLVRWTPAALDDVERWAAAQMPWPAIEAGDESARREHAFLRFLATRGQASLADAKLFGVKAPHAAMRRWVERGWCVGSVQRLVADPVLLETAAHASLIEAPPPPPPRQPEVVEVVEATVVTPDQGEGSRLWLWSSLVVVAAATAVWLGQGDSRAMLQGWLMATGDGADETPTLVQSPDLDPRAMEASSSRSVKDPELKTLELPELYLDGRLVRPQVEVHATVAGRLRWQPKYRLTGAAIEGAEVAVLTQTAGIDRSARLEALQTEMETEFAARQAQAVTDWKASERRHQEDKSQAEAQVVALERRLPAAREAYRRTRALAEEGILSFREVRPDWEALLALEEQLEEAKTEVVAAERALLAWQEAGPPDLITEASWQAQNRALEVQLEEAKASRIEVGVKVARAGEFRPLASDGEQVLEGQIIGLLTPWNDGYLEAVLATPDWNPAYLAGNARLRRPGRSSWMPTRILSAASEPDGLTRLRLRLPVGWLDDTHTLADADRELLELRLTPPPPQSQPESRPEAVQPPAGPPVELPQ